MIESGQTLARCAQHLRSGVGREDLKAASGKAFRGLTRATADFEQSVVGVKIRIGNDVVDQRLWVVGPCRPVDACHLIEREALFHGLPAAKWQCVPVEPVPRRPAIGEYIQVERELAGSRQA